MPLRLRQVQTQSQKLILSPQMQQAIHMLQMPLMELSQLAQQELAANPLLEEETQETEPEAESLDSEADQEFQQEFEKLAQLDDEWREYFRQVGTVRRMSQEEEERRKYFEDSITTHETLQEHLETQFTAHDLSDEEKEIGQTIIGNIDENGYLQADLENIAQAAKTTLPKTEKMLKLIQTFHPVGSGARNVSECLMLQLKKLGKDGPVVSAIVSSHLDALAKRHYAQIAKALNTPVEEVQRAAGWIANLEPKPGRLFAPDRTQYIVPDVVVEKIGEDYVVLPNDDRVPHLRISNLYRNLINQQETQKDTREYVKDKVKSGLWFIKNIQQRQQTILNIANRIVESQREFLDDGISKLKPMTMREMAETVGIHESTVSRAIANKYMQTPQGVFQMKFFFTTSIQTESGENLSAENVKNRIQELIAAEDTSRPLSDQKIIEVLGQEGIKLARRTVAKYRAELNIAPTNLRKKL